MQFGPKIQLGWLGSTDDDALIWLQDRLRETGDLTQFNEHQGAIETERLQACKLDRLIVPCQNRLYYPNLSLQQLASELPEVPIALALGSWWDGAGRTGLQHKSHVAIPWHRWWDGWARWIAGDISLLAPCPTQHEHLRLGDYSPIPNAQISDANGLIVANCARTASSWQLAAETFGFDAERVCLKDFWTFTAQTTRQNKPSWILWDDTCLNTATAESDACVRFFSAARSLFPHALLCGAFTLPRWSLWANSFEAGADEFIVKPNGGVALARLLRKRLANHPIIFA